MRSPKPASETFWATKSPAKSPCRSASPNSARTRSMPYMNSQWAVATSTPSRFMARTMSSPRLHSAVAEPWSVSPPSGSNSSKCRPPSSAASWRGEIPALPATTRSLSRSRRVTCMVMAAGTASRRVATLIARVKNHGGSFRRGAGVAKPGCPHPLQKYRCRGAGCPCPFQKMAVTPTSVPNPRHAHRLAVVERRQVELELGVLDGVGGQHVGAERRHAPLEAPANVPGGALTGAPRREVARESLGHVDEHPAAQELVGAALGRVAVGARVIALADPPVERRLAPGP